MVTPTKRDVLPVVDGQSAINPFPFDHAYPTEYRLCNELLFMVLSYCDIATLLSLYADPVWHYVVLDALCKSHKDLLNTSSVEMTSFVDVLDDIMSLSFEDR